MTIGDRADVTVITTNSVVKNDQRLVMGRGLAKAALDKYPGIDKQIGLRVKAYGNHVHVFHCNLERASSEHVRVIKPARVFASFPVKTDWRQPADLELIKRSLGELLLLTYINKWQRVVLPRPGCGNGRLKWDEVKPLCEEALDHRFIIVYDGS